jgi:PKHD-type hydroxylase
MWNPIRMPFGAAGLDESSHWLEGCEAPRIEWNSAVTAVSRFPRFVPATTCHRIAAAADRFPDEPGRMEDGHADKRRNRVHWIAFQDETRWLFDLAAALILEANRDYQFDLAGFAEPLHVVDYGPGEFIDWHLDCAYKQTSTRKLVATILLSSPRSYKGGGLEFSATAGRPPREQIGDGLVFPAFLSHRVKPVLSGRRRVLVAWAHGPAFR